MAERKKKEISIPSYSLGEELFNAISHGFGALLSIAALVLMLIRARNALEVTTAAIFGTSMIFLYTIWANERNLKRKIYSTESRAVCFHTARDP